MKRLSVIFVCIFVLGLVLIGCADINFGGDEDKWAPVIGTGPGVKISEDLAKEADEFSAKLIFQKGIGDFEFTAYKMPQGLGNFLLKVRNANSYPTQATVVCLYKKQSGEVVTAITKETDVTVPGIEDILAFTIDDSLLQDGYDQVEITAYAIPKNPNIVRMVDTFSPSRVNVTTGDTVTGGEYDGWQKVDVKISEDGIIGNADALFFDENNYLTYYLNVWTREKQFHFYCPEVYDHVEINTRKLLEDVPELPESVYEEYRSAGFVTAVDGTTTYKSPDGFVEYGFQKAPDGKILLHAQNLTDKRIDWYVNNTVVYSGSRNLATNNLFLDAGEEIYWDMCFDDDSEFCLLFPTAYFAEDNNLKAPEITISESGGQKLITVNTKPTMKSKGFEDDNTVICSATVVYYQGEKIAGAEYIEFDSEMIKYQKEDTVELKYGGEYDSYKIYSRYEQQYFAQMGY